MEDERLIKPQEYADNGSQVDGEPTVVQNLHGVRDSTTEYMQIPSLVE